MTPQQLAALNAIDEGLRVLTTDEVRALLYFLFWSSQRHLREGSSFINGLLAANLN